MHHSSRVSAFRRGLNSHDAAEPRILGCPPHWTMREIPAGFKLMERGRGVMSRAAANWNYMAPPCHLEPPHCVGRPANQSVRGATAASTAASSRGPLRRRLEDAARHGWQRGAGCDCCVPAGVARPWQAHRQRSSGAALPNPSFKPSPNGGPPGPVWRYAVHFRQPGLGVLPSSPA